MRGNLVNAPLVVHMRIYHHISMLHVVAIAGAITLVAVVGLLMMLVQTTMTHTIEASEQYHKIHSLRSAAEDFNNQFTALDEKALPYIIKAVTPATNRWLVQLYEMRDSSPNISAITFSEACTPLENLIQLTKSFSKSDSSQNSNNKIATTFKREVERYLHGITQLDKLSQNEANQISETLNLRKRTSMLTIGILCLFYLSIIEHTRYWTRRRLVTPVEHLADAAIQAMSGEDELPQLEDCETHELNAIARMLSSFVGTLKTQVKERTGELERQKLQLEREIAVRRRAEDQLRHAAFHDRLTNLCNRDLLMDRLQRCMLRAKRHRNYKFAVLFLDVDRFKEVNDSLGHTVGDQLLISIARRLESCLRQGDTFSRAESNTISRIGGDEFVILLDGIKARTDASIVAERLQEALSVPFALEGRSIVSTASIGIAFNELEYDSPDHLLRDADAAMYYAKAAGKARHEIFNKQMHAEAMARLELSEDLRRAFEKDEFVVFYQPIVTLATGQICGLEALVRWNHPTKGLIAPLDFIAHAEETGLIVQLGEWVLTQACLQLKQWHNEIDLDVQLTISVNVSKRQVAEPGLVDLVKNVLKETKLSGEFLQLEITESVIMANAETVTTVLKQIKELGVQLYMDDFGTGYSSLSYLHRFPIDVLKIDREFMSTMNANKDYAGVVQTVVVLAHNLNMEVIVEGVESKDQLAQLISLDCDKAQGFFFSKPLPAKEITQMLLKRPHWIKDAAA